MAVEVKRVMEKDTKGVTRQIYPVTHVNAVEGLDQIGKPEETVKSVNGKIGSVVLTATDLGIENQTVPYANETTDGIITAEMFQQLKELLASGTSEQIRLEKVEE